MMKENEYCTVVVDGTALVSKYSTTEVVNGRSGYVEMLEIGGTRTAVAPDTASGGRRSRFCAVEAEVTIHGVYSG